MKTQETLKEAILEILNEIEKETPISVSVASMKRVKWLIEHVGEYYHKQEKNEERDSEIHGQKGRIRAYGPPETKPKGRIFSTDEGASTRQK